MVKDLHSHTIAILDEAMRLSEALSEEELDDQGCSPGYDEHRNEEEGAWNYRENCNPYSQ